MLENKVVAITGASGGIGRAIADMCISKGARVAISDLTCPRDVSQNNDVKSYKCDVSHEGDIKAFIGAVERDLGPIDMFVANAGVGYGDGVNGMVAGGDNDTWEKSFQINLMQSVYASRALLPKWVKRGEGRFVVTASAAGLINLVGSASYTASKHAAVAFAESLAISHGGDGIKAHCICPQYVNTNMTKDMNIAKNGPDPFLEPGDVATALFEAMKTDRFLVLPHPKVAEYEMFRVSDRDKWIDAMTRIHDKFIRGAKGGLK